MQLGKFFAPRRPLRPVRKERKVVGAQVCGPQLMKLLEQPELKIIRFALLGYFAPKLGKFLLYVNPVLCIVRGKVSYNN